MKQFLKIIGIILLIGLIVSLLPFLAILSIIAAIYYAFFQKKRLKALFALVAATLMFALSGALTEQNKQPASNHQETPINSRQGASKTSEKQVTLVSGDKHSKAEKTPLTSESTGKAEENGTLVFTKQKQLYLKPLDDLGRASLAHIQLQDKDEPQNDREERIEYDPVGWKNFNLYYLDGSKKSWLMSRGHLIGYQFSDLNDDPKNLVPITTWLNSGNYVGMDSGNTDGMLFYENQLDNWLANHPNFWLDYQVRAIYNGNDLWPKQIELQYVGLDESGKLLPIQLNPAKETTDSYGVTRVLLDNVSPNASIDYTKGTAQGTVESAEVQERARQAQAQQEASHQQTASENALESSNAAVAPTTDSGDGDTLVYVTGGGKSEVYWYSTANMPYNTNLNNLVQMTKSEAEALGKRHSLSE